MANLADVIEAYLKKLMAEQEQQQLEVTRRELAAYFNCVPSQITYVLQTRFTPQKGYRIESIRGGGGYIRIIQQTVNSNILSQMNTNISEKVAGSLIDELYERQLISRETRNLMQIATADRSLGLTGVKADITRGRLLRALCSYCLAE